MIKWSFAFLPFIALSQSFAPEPGVAGSTAIHKDSSAITFWADDVYIQRGFLDIEDQNQGFASFGTAADAEGPADGISVVSLGDGGIATYYFTTPLTNGAGPDFAVFENGFADHYIELAFVEVSSDNQNYYRFPAISEIPTETQLSNFDFIDCRYVHNFAGKYRAGYGTPFDLQDLDTVSQLDISAITSIRIVDVVGSLDSTFGTFDALGTIVNDPYPTAFPSGGFDLDGLAILQPYLLNVHEEDVALRCYPNPATDYLHIEANQFVSYEIFDGSGRLILSGNSAEVDVRSLSSGVYSVVVRYGSQTAIRLMRKS